MEKMLNFLLENYSEKNEQRIQQKEKILLEVELLQKQRFTNQELKSLSVCCQMQQKESIDNVTYVLAIIALVTAMVGNIIGVFSGFSASVETVGDRLLQSYLLFSILITGVLVIYVLIRIIKAGRGNIRLRNKMIAIELLLGMQEIREQTKEEE